MAKKIRKKDSQSMAQERLDYIRQLKSSIEKVVHELKGKVKKISLFGSYPERADLFSDLDLLIIMETDQPYLKRLEEIYSRLSLPVDADILCYTPEEIRLMKRRGFWRHISKKEVVLYEEKSKGRRKTLA